MDPSYNVLLQSEKSKDKCAVAQKTKSKNKIKAGVLIAVLVTVGGLIISGAVLFAFYPRIRLYCAIKKASM